MNSNAKMKLRQPCRTTTLRDEDNHDQLTAMGILAAVSAKSGVPKIEMLQTNGQSSFEVALDSAVTRP